MLSVLERFGLLITTKKASDPDTVTYNGNPSFSTIGKPHLDFYGGVTRQTDVDRIDELAQQCVKSDLRLAVPTFFQKRNCRGGSGERKPFIAAFTHLPSELRRRLYPLIPQYGYWKDLLALANSLPQDRGVILELMSVQLLANMFALTQKDVKVDRNLEKWLPSEGCKYADQIDGIINFFNVILGSQTSSKKDAGTRSKGLNLRDRACNQLSHELDARLAKINPNASSILFNVHIEGDRSQGFKVILKRYASSSDDEDQGDIEFAYDKDPRFIEVIRLYDHILSKAMKLPTSIRKLTKAGYRKWLTYRRAHDAVVEHYKSEDHWDLIEYSMVPSIAFDRTKKQFKKHDSDRFGKFIDSVAKGEATINVGRLMPYELLAQESSEVRDQQWRLVVEETKAYYKDVPLDSPFHPSNSIHVADVSYSMKNKVKTVVPIDVSRALAILMAEVGQRPLYTFSGEAKRYDPIWTNLTQALALLKDKNCSTNFKGLIDRIYSDCAMTASLKGRDLSDVVPGSIVIYTDGGFDQMCHEKPTSAMEYVQKKFAGLTRMPVIVFWNVAGNTSDFVVKEDTPGMIQLAGFSKDCYELFTRLTSVDELNPEMFFRADVLSPAYAPLLTVYDQYVQNH